MQISARILSESDIERVEAQAMSVMERVGMMVDNDILCDLARRRGAAVDGRCVRVPAEMVRWALQVGPRHIQLHGRNGDVLPLEHGQCHISTYAEAVNVVDYEATHLRPSTLKDTVDFVRLGQAMPEVSIVGPVCFARDLPGPIQLLRTAEVVVLNSNKHIMAAPLNLEEAQLWYDLMQLAAPDQDLAIKPLLTLVVSPTSPLQFDRDTSQVMQFAAERKIPFVAASCPLAGATSPLALIGTVVQLLAEDLFILTLAQIVNPGAPVIMGGAAGLLDMRTGALSYGAPERHLLLGAIIELADHYGLPHHSPAGSVDACYPDVHAGAEKMQCWMARRAHDIVFGIAFGSLYNGRAVSLEQMVIDADLWQESGRYFRGMDLSTLDESSTVIEQVGPGGKFLAVSQTLRLMRSQEMYYSQIANRQGDQGPSMLERAHQQVRRLLAQSAAVVAEPVSEAVHCYVAKREATLLSSH